MPLSRQRQSLNPIVECNWTGSASKYRKEGEGKKEHVLNINIADIWCLIYSSLFLHLYEKLL